MNILNQALKVIMLFLKEFHHAQFRDLVNSCQLLVGLKPINRSFHFTHIAKIRVFMKYFTGMMNT